MKALLSAETKLLTVQQVAARLALSVRTVWRRTATGELPAPVRFPGRIVRWRSRDLDRYIDQLPVRS
jgi:excisionase family DNA binding protein